MASTELIVAFEAKIDGLTTNLRRVTEQVKDLQSVVGTAGDKMQKSIEKTERSVSVLAVTTQALKVYFAATFAVGIVTSFASAIDSVTGSINRLKAITGSSLSQSVDQFNRLNEIASRTGQPIADMTNQFQRFFVATAQLGTSRAQIEQLSGVLAGFAQLSGQRPQEASAAITQLSQALASGRLNGDELKSIMENLPQLAIAIAKELGVSVGELRKMGEEGKLVAERVLPAILNSARAQQEQLNRLPLTLAQGWTAFSNGALAAIGAVDRAIGASEFVGKLLAAIGTAGRDIATRVEGTGPNAAPGAALSNLTREASSLNRLLNEAERSIAGMQSSGMGNSAIGRNQIAALTAQADGLRTRLAALNIRVNNAGEASSASATAGDRPRAEAAIVSAAGAASTASTTLAESANPILRIRRESTARLEAVETAYRAQVALATLTRQQAGEAATEAERERLRAASTVQFRDAEIQKVRDLASARTILNREMESATSGARADAQRQASEDQERANRAARATATARESAAVIARAGGSTVEGLTEAYNRWNAAVENGNSNYQNFANRVAGDTQLAIVGFRAVGSAAETVASQMVRLGQEPAAAVAVMNAEMIKFRDLMLAAGSYTPEQIELIEKAMTDAAANTTITIERVRERATSTWNDIAAQGAKAFSGGLADSIVSFGDTAKKSFADMTADFLKNIAKMILNAMILRAIVAGLRLTGNSTLGGIADIISPAPRQSGGPVTGGTPYIVGERQPELFVPGASGYVVPSVPGGGGGETNITIINNSKAQVSQSSSQNSSGGADIGILVEDAVNNALAAGRFDKTFGATFGVRRVGRN